MFISRNNALAAKLSELTDDFGAHLVIKEFNDNYVLVRISHPDGVVEIKEGYSADNKYYYTRVKARAELSEQREADGCVTSFLPSGFVLSAFSSPVSSASSASLFGSSSSVDSAPSPQLIIPSRVADLADLLENIENFLKSFAVIIRNNSSNSAVVEYLSGCQAYLESARTQFASSNPVTEETFVEAMSAVATMYGNFKNSLQTKESRAVFAREFPRESAEIDVFLHKVFLKAASISDPSSKRSGPRLG